MTVFLDGVPDEESTARFVCAIAAAFRTAAPGSKRDNGRNHRPWIAGENGFGYDPIFFLPEHGCTSAQAPEKKNELSHRGEGLRKMRIILEEKMKRNKKIAGMLYEDIDSERYAQVT